MTREDEKREAKWRKRALEVERRDPMSPPLVRVQVGRFDCTVMFLPQHGGWWGGRINDRHPSHPYSYTEQHPTFEAVLAELRDFAKR